MSGLTPYISPSLLQNAPTGISWKTIPTPQSTFGAQLAEQFNMCLRATHAIEAYVNQTLRATIDVQTETGPSRRLTVEPSTGVLRMVTDQWPVLGIVSGQVAVAATFPRVWVPIPLNQMDIELGVPVNTGSAVPGGAANGGNSVLIGPGYADWTAGRKGFRVQVSYLNGWPHAGLMAAAVAGATTLTLDDVTGYGIASLTTPVSSTMYEGATSEVISVTGCTATNGSSGVGANGPGTINVPAGIVFNHDGPIDNIAGTLVSAMPLVVQRAAILLACHEALVRGSSATTVPRQPGSIQHGGKDGGLDLNAFELLLPFKRVY